MGDVGSERGTDEYPTGTGEYPPEGGGRQGSEAPPKDAPWDNADPEGRAVVDHLLERGDERQKGEAEFAKELWFINVRGRGKELADDNLRSFARFPGILRSRRRELPARSTVPAPARPETTVRGPVTSKQVGVKLIAEDHARLQRAAQLYGLPPSTLARLLVNRGVGAIPAAEGAARDG